MDKRHARKKPGIPVSLCVTVMKAANWPAIAPRTMPKFSPIPARTGIIREITRKEFRASLVTRSLAKNIQDSPEY